MKNSLKKKKWSLLTCAMLPFLFGSVVKAQKVDLQVESGRPIEPNEAQLIVTSYGKNQGKSPYFSSSLSSDQCTYVVSEVLKVKGYNSQNRTLDIILDHLLMECGIADSNLKIESEPIGFRFENSDLFILWDGHSISFNDKAQSTLELTMSSSFNNIIAVTKIKTEASSQVRTSFVERIKAKVDTVKENLFEVYENGKTHIIFSGIAYHKRSSYPNWKSLNEFAAGIGIERARFTENGNRESVSAMVFLDSHSDPEYSISYELAKPWSIGKGVLVWAGVNAGFTSRRDIMNHIPVPYVFPTLGLSVGKLAVRSILIPRVGSAGGNVLFLFGSYQM
jgi:Antimicrobial peptide resistance and lipid A acylation protein PagP